MGVASLCPPAAGAQAPAPPTQPKLVLGIVVEDLQTEYLSLLRDNFTAGGFNRFLDNGVYIPYAEFGAPVDAAAATAILYTGASPSVNGIASEEIFDRETLRTQPVFADASASGVHTREHLSPRALAVTTIADETRIAGGGVTFAYSIATDPSIALIMGGHAGNCAMWVNDATDDWSTTSFYKEVPTTLVERNRFNPLRSRIDTMTWAPMHDSEKYVLLPEHATMYPFKYNFHKSGLDRISAFKQSPKANDEVTAFALENLRALRLGKHDGPDMLSLAYTLTPYAYSKRADNRYELYDAYYRLDRNLAQLLDSIDSRVGMDNTLVFLAATPPSQRSRREEEYWQLPYGEFSTRKALSLLNMYLIAKFGNGNWAQGYHNGQIYLNHKLIDEKNISIEEIRLETARFLEKMSGVKIAYSIEEIIDGRSADTAPLRQSTVIDTAGDVWFSIMPGWQIIDDFNKPQQTTDQVVRAAATTAPVFFLIPKSEPRKIDRPVDARTIAPTITSLLRIRSPNAAENAPLF